jgi:hypothetical protein
VRSDIYALGLILYELCSGKKALTATTLAELREQKERHTPRALSEIRSSMDPVLERLITRSWLLSEDHVADIPGEASHRRGKCWGVTTAA